VSSIKAAGVPADYLLCKLFPHSLAGRGTSWLRQLEPGSLTNWIDTKNAFMIHFLDDSVTELLRKKLSSFSQAPTEGLKAAWIRFKSYLRECPQHGFQESQLINIFYRGIALPYEAQLDAASYCNFMTRTTSEALLLITNALTSRCRSSLWFTIRLGVEFRLSFYFILFCYSLVFFLLFHVTGELQDGKQQFAGRFRRQCRLTPTRCRSTPSVEQTSYHRRLQQSWSFLFILTTILLFHEESFETRDQNGVYVCPASWRTNRA